MRRAMIVALGLALVAVYAVARVAAVSSYVVYVPMVYAQPSVTQL